MLNKICTRLVVFLILAFFSQSASGIVMLQNGVKGRTIKPEEISIYTDHSDTIDLKKVLSGEQKPKFLPLKSTTLPPIHQGTFWLRLLVINDSVDEQSWVLQCTEPNIRVFEVWTPDKRGGYHLQRSGLVNVFSKKYNHKDHVFELPSGLKHYIVYLKVASPNTVNLNLKIRSQEYFTEATIQDYLIYGISYGFLLVLLLLGVIRYLTGSAAAYIFLALHLLACLLLSLSRDGLGAQFIWTSYASGNLYYYYFLAPQVILVASVLFARSFLNLKERFPAGDNILLAAAGIILSLMVARSSMNDFSFPIWYGIPFLLINGIAAYVWFKGYKPARLFLTGNIIIGSATFFLLQKPMEGLMAANFIQIGILTHGLIWWMALDDRNNFIKKQKETALRITSTKSSGETEKDTPPKHQEVTA